LEAQLQGNFPLALQSSPEESTPPPKKKKATKKKSERLISDGKKSHQAGTEASRAKRSEKFKGGKSLIQTHKLSIDKNDEDLAPKSKKKVKK